MIPIWRQIRPITADITLCECPHCGNSTPITQQCIPTAHCPHCLNPLSTNYRCPKCGVTRTLDQATIDQCQLWAKQPYCPHCAKSKRNPWQLITEPSTGIFVYKCQNCDNTTTTEGPPPNTVCPTCVDNGLVRGRHLFKELFGHWQPLSKDGAKYICRCTKCQQTTPLKLSQFFYWQLKCPHCHQPKYKVTIGTTYGHWRPLTANDTTFTCECTQCHATRELKFMQFVYDSCRLKCKCQRITKGTKESKLTPGHTYGTWCVTSVLSNRLIIAQCTICKTESEQLGYRILYPKFAPKCRTCRNKQ